MEIQEARSLQDLNLMDRFLFDETMEVPGMYQIAEAASSERIKRMHREVQKIKASEKMGVKYMQKWEERVYDRLEGELEGRRKAKNNLNKLNHALIRDNRLDDLLQSTTDLKFQEKLLEEYHISV